MTCGEADDFLIRYRAWLKAWALAVASFAVDDSEALGVKLSQGREELARIALAYPEKSSSVSVLINARSRTWGGPYLLQ